MILVYTHSETSQSNTKFSACNCASVGNSKKHLYVTPPRVMKHKKKELKHEIVYDSNKIFLIIKSMKHDNALDTNLKN